MSMHRNALVGFLQARKGECHNAARAVPSGSPFADNMSGKAAAFDEVHLFVDSLPRDQPAFSASHNGHNGTAPLPAAGQALLPAMHVTRMDAERLLLGLGCLAREASQEGSPYPADPDRDRELAKHLCTSHGLPAPAWLDQHQDA